MKVYLDKEKIKKQMKLRGFKTFTKLCNEAGTTQNCLSNKMARRTSSLNAAWLLADCLGCYIDDIVSVDWEA